MKSHEPRSRGGWPSLGRIGISGNESDGSIMLRGLMKPKGPCSCTVFTWALKAHGFGVHVLLHDSGRAILPRVAPNAKLPLESVVT